MNQLLLWSFAFTAPGALLTALGVGRRPGTASLLGPIALFAIAVAYLAQGAPQISYTAEGWAPFLPDGAFRLAADPLTGVMLAVVGGVASCVYVYSLEYMGHDPRARRYFCFLDLFVATMTLLIVAGNLSVLLIGWAGVGVSSFLLISFYWQKPGTLLAGMQALGANAIGDAALLTAVVLLPKGCGAFGTLAQAVCTEGAVSAGASGIGGPATIAFLLVLAACAKSAQGPLWFWLPSAMAGPTPVSALIHAATMVAAGVYLLVRTSPSLALSPEAMQVTAWVGVVTAIAGGTASLWQPNFKRGLAFSTVSQLGYMFAAVGVGAPFAALFHLLTHASFKALLFLCSGVVIHALDGEERLDHMGGLGKELSSTKWLFLIGSLALIGTPLFAGFYSKDLIIASALHHTPVIGWLLLAGAGLTGLYTGRLYAGVFLGPKAPGQHHAHAPGPLMIGALVPLAAGAVVLGYTEAGTHALSSLLHGTVAGPHEVVAFFPTTSEGLLLGLGAFALGLAGFLLAVVLVARTGQKTLPLPAFGLPTAIWGEIGLLPLGVVRAHSGRLGLYVLVTLLGTAAILALGLR